MGRRYAEMEFIVKPNAAGHFLTFDAHPACPHPASCLSFAFRIASGATKEAAAA
jgi:hypothetical protein